MDVRSYAAGTRRSATTAVLVAALSAAALTAAAQDQVITAALKQEGPFLAGLPPYLPKAPVDGKDLRRSYSIWLTWAQ